MLLYSDNSIGKAKRVGTRSLEVSEIVNIIDLERLPVGTCWVVFFQFHEHNTPPSSPPPHKSESVPREPCASQ